MAPSGTVAPSTATATAQTPRELEHPDAFVRRHIGAGPRGRRGDAEVARRRVARRAHRRDGAEGDPRPKKPLALEPARTEHEALAWIRSLAVKNRIGKSYLGMGYSGTLVPPVIQRNIVENPGWYTQYTPVPGRDLAGSPRGDAQLPDDGLRPDGDGDHERVDARRGDRRRRGDAPLLRGVAEREGEDVLRRRRLPSPDDRRRQDAREAARDLDRGGRPCDVRLQEGDGRRPDPASRRPTARSPTPERSSRRRMPPARSSWSPPTCSR